MKAITAILGATCLFSSTVAAAEPPSIDPARFARIVGQADTVVFGEDSHGMEAIHDLVPRLFEYLVVNRGCRVFVFEAQWGVTEGLQDFLDSDRTELSATDSYWLNGAFASKPIAGMLVWIRDWNRSHPNDRIQIAGYQPEQPVTDLGALRAHLDRFAEAAAPAFLASLEPCLAGDTAKYRTELDFIIDRGKAMKAGTPSYTPDERKRCLAALDGLDAFLRTHPSTDGSADRIARLHVLSLRTYVDVLRRAVDELAMDPNRLTAQSLSEQQAVQGLIYGKGDAARFRIYRELRSIRFPRAKVFHWMHNWHAARHASETAGIAGSGGSGIPQGTVSFGERLAGAEGSSLRTFLTLVPCGATCTEPESSVETVFDRRFGDRAAVVDTRDRAAVRALRMDVPRTMYANHHQFGFGTVVLTRQADGVVYLPRSARVR